MRSLLVLMWLPASQAICSRTTTLSRRQAFEAALSAAAVSWSPGVGRAASADYDKFAADYDILDDGSLSRALGLDKLRASTIRRAEGRVLEVGVGTGLNLPLYLPERVSEVVGVDLSPGMLQEARRRVSASVRVDPVQLKVMDVGKLDFADGTFDTVVDTFSLCVFPEPLAALKEMGRVCRSDGRLLLLEHSRADELGPIAAYQDLTAKPIAAAGKGCVWNQQVDVLLKDAGLEVVESKAALGGFLRAIVARPLRRIAA